MTIPARATAVLLILLAATRTASADDVLLGRVDRETILSISPEWRTNRDAYEPDAADIRRLASSTLVVRLDTYFGSWCSDSRKEVPRLLKILDRAAPKHLRVKFYGLDRAKKEPHRLVKRGTIVRVPTFILTVDGREIGRIVETPRTSLEHDLAALLERSSPAPPPTDGPPAAPGL